MLVTNLSIDSVYYMLYELKSLLHSTKTYNDSCYKRFVFGYDPVLAKLFSDVFPNFDITTTVYYSTNNGVNAMQENYYKKPADNLLNVKFKLWLDRENCM